MPFHSLYTSCNLVFMYVMHVHVCVNIQCVQTVPIPQNAQSKPVLLGPAIKVGVMEFKGMEHQTRDEQAEAL